MFDFLKNKFLINANRRFFEKYVYKSEVKAALHECMIKLKAIDSLVLLFKTFCSLDELLCPGNGTISRNKPI